MSPLSGQSGNELQLETRPDVLETQPDVAVPFMTASAD
jgi:hypothetical protein